MKPALTPLVLLPPPAPGALTLARLDGAGAGFAADRGVALRMQRVDRNLVGARQGFEVGKRLVGQRIDLEQAAVGVPFGQR